MAYGTLSADNIQSSSAGTTPPKFLNNAGAELGQLCAAWCDFNGTLSGTITPRASFNVSSITKNGTGDYSINFTNALADANYALVGMSDVSSTTVISSKSSTTKTSTQARVITFASTTGTATDSAFVDVGAFR